MDKVILTKEQVQALENLRFGGWDDEHLIKVHKIPGEWHGIWSCLNDLSIAELHNALQCGYQTKEDYIQELEKNANKCERDTDNVNKPSHYTTGQIEVIEYIKDKLTPEQYVGYCMGNVIKYTSRWEHKGGVQDLEKAEVYLKWAIKAAEENE